METESLREASVAVKSVAAPLVAFTVNASHWHAPP
jgi:hypothetical protein